MKKKSLIFYFIMLMLICQGVPWASAITEGQSAAIVDHCDTIREDLKKVQKEDARVRVYLGGYYETILTKFVTPLNVRLVENNLSSADLVENQNDFAAAKALFVNDFVTYQQGLEELVGMDCKKEPEKFYDNLRVVRQKRKVMTQDVLKIRSLTSAHIRLVEGLKGRL
ncbi:hypothetical protein IKF43_00040 [Candidatus Saccharibacteria bacterium]|nr:hypothetical protein [Candidatus Saccharibacteria bacterium]